MSLITINNEVPMMFKEFKLSHKWRYIIFKMNDKLTEVIIDKIGQYDETYDDFTKALSPKAARFCVYDLHYTQVNGKREKIIFYLWSPSKCSLKEKVIFSATKVLVKQVFEGIAAEVQATCDSELDIERVLDKVKSVSRE
ncbi:actophorin, putative [Entamoeba invadens IP1]|uniref:Actophorin, putative n=1 Tax=Entamoeba invadens IP1 TaxID=370355 RepID=L7FQ99_ENTIV|nr:actophorin, putative [Entamoeba invadens IP1]ELP92963.1 actophorin, putative [Entamoeba invadens IP1]|eukprot:XP_004259734.1 actophorin, putative [Entamoeba invadens IP1]